MGTSSMTPDLRPYVDALEADLEAAERECDDRAHDFAKEGATMLLSWNLCRCDENPRHDFAMADIGEAYKTLYRAARAVLDE